MNAVAAATPIEKSVVLVGAGNAHLVFAKRWGMRPLPGVAVTLVNETPLLPYSAMVPGHIGGDYAIDEMSIDLVRFCQSVKIRLVADSVTRLDTATRTVGFDQRPTLSYDVLSLGLGSIPACPMQGAPHDGSLLMRPLGTLLKQLDDLEIRLRNAASFHLAVVGGGASGGELALAIQRRFGARAGFRMTLVQGDARLLPQFPAKVGLLFAKALAARRIDVRLGDRVTGWQGGSLKLASGREIGCDAVLWATHAAPPPLLRESGLPLDDGGFLLVQDTLQTSRDPAVFGTGDCVTLSAYPLLSKNGVHAVRQGAVLFDNVAAFLHERPLRAFRPQRFCLTLLNTGDGKAVFNYGPLVLHGRWARRLKNRIDRAWMARFTRFAPMAANAAKTPLMRCGGCGSKISSDVLSAVLRRLEGSVGDDPRLLLGTRAGEDAAVFRARPELFGSVPGKLVEVQTVDHFRAFIDDPFVFGRIAALHAVSDLYAMNARPFAALAIATLPYARGPVQEAQLYELLAGAMWSFRELGVTLAGGHTTEGSELALGFAVTGHGEEDRLFEKRRLQVGDVLVLTKALGSGALLAAWMRSACKAAWFENLLRSMYLPNRAAAEVFSAAGVTACTDVTGFGLAGHLLEMLDASHVGARLNASAVPRLAGFDEVVAQGIVSTLRDDNAKLACRIASAGPLPEWLFDPQTSGGLLAGVNPARLATTLDQLRQSGCEAAAIGEVVSGEGTIELCFDEPVRQRLESRGRSRSSDQEARP